MLINIIIPCYNEEETLPWSMGKLQEMAIKLTEETGARARFLLIDDGSRDHTWQLIEKYSSEHENVSGLKLAHNEGHQTAVWAGLEASVDRCDATVTIDADLQDDEYAIIDMTRQFKEGKDIVYGVRKERTTDTFFKRFTAQSFYKLMHTVDPEIVYNHADFRLMSNRATKALTSYPERNLFIRGLVPQLGYPTGCSYYDRKARTAGESKYPLSKMLGLAIDGITSLSISPIRGIIAIGIIFLIISIISIIYSITRYTMGEVISGWTSIFISMWFIGGMIITSLGVIGLYVGKIYKEVKQRPRYFFEKTANYEIKHDK